MNLLCFGKNAAHRAIIRLYCLRFNQNASNHHLKWVNQLQNLSDLIDSVAWNGFFSIKIALISREIGHFLPLPLPVSLNNLAFHLQSLLINSIKLPTCYVPPFMLSNKSCKKKSSCISSLYRAQTCSSVQYTQRKERRQSV